MTSRPFPPLLLLWISVTPLLLGVGGVRALLPVAAEAAEEGLEEPEVDFRTLLLEDPSQREALIEANPPWFRALYDSILADADLSISEDSEFLEQVALDYLSVTEDSLLVFDYRFVVGAAREAVGDWYNATLLGTMGQALRAQGEYAGSVNAFTESAEAYRRIGHLRREALAWGSLGVSLWYVGDLDRARDAYQNALDARRRLGDPVLIARALNGLGSVTAQLGRYEEAFTYHRQAREIQEGLDMPVELGTTMADIGRVYEYQGDLEAARSHYLQALALLGPDAPVQSLDGARLGLAAVYSNLGESRKALALYRDVLTDTEEAGDSGRAARIRKSMGLEYMALREYGSALPELELARRIQEEEEDFYELSATCNLEGSAYLARNDLPAAREAFLRARRWGEESGNALEFARSFGHLGVVYSRLGEAHRALEAYDEALVAHQEIGNLAGVRQGLQGKAVLLEGQGDAQAALELHREVLGLDREWGYPHGQAVDHLNIGNVLMGMRRLGEARASYEAGLALALDLAMQDLLGPFYAGIGDCFERTGMLDSARVYNGLAIGALESWGGRAPTEGTVVALRGGWAPLYRRQIHLLAKLHRSADQGRYAEEAFTVAERERVWDAMGTLAEGQVDLSATLGPAIKEERERLERALSSVHYQLRLVGRGEAPGASLGELKRRLGDLEEKRRAFHERLRRRHSRYALLDPGGPGNLKEIRRRLLPRKDDLLLEYSLGDSASYLWVVTSRDLTLHRLPPRREIETRALSLRGRLANPFPDGDAALVTLASSLYQTILEPAEGALARADRVYIVPDGALTFIPFDALLTESSWSSDPQADPHQRNLYFSRLPYAFQDTELHYGPSATFLATLASGKGQDSPRVDMEFLGVADPLFQSYSVSSVPVTTGLGAELIPLPVTREEVDTIADRFDERERTVLLGKEATEGTLVWPGFLSRFRILHLATHGLIEEQHPLRSRLALSVSWDAREDGYLHASEIYGLQVGADLVVLSACDTGRGRMTRGEGVIGLPRSFFYAGASQVMMSLWTSPDPSTAKFMSSFYKELVRKQRGGGESLRRAKKDLRWSGTYSHPFYWARFVLLGPD